MIGIIWYYKNKDQAFEQLKKIQQGYEHIFIKTQIVRTDNNASLYCVNGDFWRVCPVPPLGRIRGHRCNISYIERGTPEEIIATFIRPCLTVYPYSAFNYYGGPTDGIDS